MSYFKPFQKESFAYVLHKSGTAIVDGKEKETDVLYCKLEPGDVVLLKGESNGWYPCWPFAGDDKVTLKGVVHGSILSPIFIQSEKDEKSGEKDLLSKRKDLDVGPATKDLAAMKGRWWDLINEDPFSRDLMIMVKELTTLFTDENFQKDDILELRFNDLIRNLINDCYKCATNPKAKPQVLAKLEKYKEDLYCEVLNYDIIVHNKKR